MTTIVESMHGRVRFVLVRPSHPGNVGAAARAMRTMGFDELVLVAPRVELANRHPDALAFASGASDVLARCRVVGSLDEALAPVHLAVALSAGAREFAPPAEPPEPMVEAVRATIARDPAARVAIVFGNERTGLSLAEAQRCQRLCAIPGASDYRSLNVAQAVQLIAYLLRREFERASPWRCAGEPGTVGSSVPSVAADGQVPAGEETIGVRERPATLAELAGMVAHVERALIRIGFLDPDSPKRLVPRIRRLVHRARPTREEVDIVRGVCTRIERIT